MRGWVLITLLLTGCATTYHASSFSGGFSETQLAENMFRVSFNGNGYTGRNRVVDFTLLRSAELTLEHGFTHFVIIDSSQHTSVSTTTTPTTAHTTGSASMYGDTVYGSSTTTVRPGKTRTISKPSSANTIVLFNGKPETGELSYDARFLFDSISKKYGITPAPPSVATP